MFGRERKNFNYEVVRECPFSPTLRYFKKMS